MAKLLLKPSNQAFELLRRCRLHGPSLFLCLLLCADLVFIALHSVDVLSPAVDIPRLSLETDNGFPEFFQYVKWLWIIILLACLSVVRRSVGYGAWAVVFVYLLVDDALGVHEMAGWHVAGHLVLTPPYGLGLQAVGELIVSFVAGLSLFALIAVAYRNGSSQFRRVSRDLCLLVLALAFFGVFFDVVHSAVQRGWEVNAVLALIEDGGEMIVASVISWYVFRLSMRADHPTGSVGAVLRSVLARRSI